MTIFGDGNQTRDYVFVDDMVHAFVQSMERGLGQAREHRDRPGGEREPHLPAARRHHRVHGRARVTEPLPTRGAPDGRARHLERAECRRSRDPEGPRCVSVSRVSRSAGWGDRHGVAGQGSASRHRRPRRGVRLRARRARWSRGPRSWSSTVCCPDPTCTTAHTPIDRVSQSGEASFHTFFPSTRSRIGLARRRAVVLDPIIEAMLRKPPGVLTCFFSTVWNDPNVKSLIDFVGRPPPSGRRPRPWPAGRARSRARRYEPHGRAHDLLDALHVVHPSSGEAPPNVFTDEPRARVGRVQPSEGNAPRVDHLALSWLSC